MSIGGRSSSVVDYDDNPFEYDEIFIPEKQESRQPQMYLHPNQSSEYSFPLPPQSPLGCSILNELDHAIQGVKDLYQSSRDAETGRDSVLEWFQLTQEEIDIDNDGSGSEILGPPTATRTAVKGAMGIDGKEYYRNPSESQQHEPGAQSLATPVHGLGLPRLQIRTQPLLTPPITPLRFDPNMSTNYATSSVYSDDLDSKTNTDSKWLGAHGYGCTTSTFQSCERRSDAYVEPVPPIPPKSILRDPSKTYGSKGSSVGTVKPEPVPWSPSLYSHHWKRRGGIPAMDATARQIDARKGIFRRRGIGDIYEDEDDYHSFISKGQVSPRTSGRPSMGQQRYGCPRTYQDTLITPPTSPHALGSGMDLQRWTSAPDSTRSTVSGVSNKGPDTTPGTRQESRTRHLQSDSTPLLPRAPRPDPENERGLIGRNKDLYDKNNDTQAGIQELAIQRALNKNAVQPYLDQLNPSQFADPDIASTTRYPDSDSQSLRASVATFDAVDTKTAERVRPDPDCGNAPLNAVSDGGIQENRSWSEFCKLAGEILQDVVEERHKTHASKAFSNAEKIERNHYLDKKFMKLMGQAQKQSGYIHVDTVTAVKQFMVEHKRLGSIGTNPDRLSNRSASTTTTTVSAQKTSRFSNFLRVLEKSVKTVLVVPSDPELKSYSRTHPPRASSTRGVEGRPGDAVSMAPNSVSVADFGLHKPENRASMSLKAKGKQPVRDACDSRLSTQEAWSAILTTPRSGRLYSPPYRAETKAMSAAGTLSTGGWPMNPPSAFTGEEP